MKLNGLLFIPVAVSLLLPGASSASAAMIYTFLPDPPSGNIQGAAGSTIGWGYSITNHDSADWLVTTNLAADPFADANPDASLFDFPTIAPGATVSLAYDPVNDAGLFALTWHSNAPARFSDSGLFALDAEWWTGDPLAGGTFIQNAVEVTSAYSATVSGPSSGPGPVPEPRAILLFPTALLGLLVLKRVGCLSA